MEGVDERKIEEYLSRQGIASMQDLGPRAVSIGFSLFSWKMNEELVMFYWLTICGRDGTLDLVRFLYIRTSIYRTQTGSQGCNLMSGGWDGGGGWSLIGVGFGYIRILLIIVHHLCNISIANLYLPKEKKYI